MGRMYVVTFSAVATTVAADLFEITPADDKPLAIHALFLGQTTELGDAAEEQLQILVVRGHTTSGSGGSSATPAPIGPNDTAAGFTAEVNNTTQASIGTTVNLHVDTWNVRGPYQIILTPEMRWRVSQANTTLVVRLGAAPADSITISGTLYVEELD